MGSQVSRYNLQVARVPGPACVSRFLDGEVRLQYDHSAEKGCVSDVHNGMAREEISIQQATKVLDAKPAVDNKWTAQDTFSLDREQ